MEAAAARKPSPSSRRSPEPSQPSLELVPPSPENPDREPEQLVLLRTLQVVRDRVESLHAQQKILVEGLRDLRDNLPQQRRPLSRRTQSLHIEAVLRKRAGLCPCCQETPVADDQGRLAGAEFDHWYSRSQNGVKQTWLICGPCNARLAIDTEFKAACRSSFEAFQQALRPLLSKQTQFTLDGSAA
jgi:hypothetical protein